MTDARRKAELLRDLRDLAVELGETPTQSDVNEHFDYTHSVFYTAFGSLNTAKEQLGLALNKENNAPRVTLGCAGPNCTETVAKTEREVEQSEYHYCSQDCLNEHKRERYAGDGNPNSTLEAVTCDHCGQELMRARWERERYERTYCSECWGDVTVEVECAWCGGEKQVWPSLTHVERHFCSPQCHGKWNSVHNTGEKHPRWRPGKRPEYYGPNWRVQRRRVLRRDQYRCQDCGVTEAEYLTERGETLSVHHIQPFRTFETDDGYDYEAANSLENLITVCRECHMEREMALES